MISDLYIGRPFIVFDADRTAYEKNKGKSSTKKLELVCLDSPFSIIFKYL